jgi:aspartate/glutamate racemase
MQIAVEKLASRGATIVVNGCSAVNLVGARSALEVIDPAEIALRLIQDRKNSLEANYGKI